MHVVMLMYDQNNNIFEGPNLSLLGCYHKQTMFLLLFIYFYFSVYLRIALIIQVSEVRLS